MKNGKGIVLSFVLALSLAGVPSHAFLGGGALSAAAIQKAFAAELTKFGRKMMREGFDGLKGSLSIGQQVNAYASAAIHKEKISEYITSKMGDVNPGFRQTTKDAIDGCLSSMFGRLGFHFKLPSIKVCGVNLTDRIVSALAKDYKTHYTLRDVYAMKFETKSKGVSDVPRAEKRKILQELKDSAQGKDSQKSEPSMGTRDMGDDPKDARSAAKRSNRFGISGAGSSNVEIAAAATPSAYFSGTESDASQRSFVNVMRKKTMDRAITNEADFDKSEVEGLCIADVNAKKLERYDGSDILSLYSIPFPIVSVYSSKMNGEKLLSSRPDGKVATVGFVTVSVKDYVSGKKRELASNYVSAWNRYLKGDSGRISASDIVKSKMDLGKIARMSAKATLGAISTIKGESDEGKSLINAELLKGILLQLAILNTQLANAETRRAREEFRNEVYTRERLDSMQNDLDLISQKITQYGKNALRLMKR